MEINEEMLTAAVRQACKDGLIPKHGDLESYVEIWQSVKNCIQAALDERTKQLTGE